MVNWFLLICVYIVLSIPITVHAELEVVDGVITSAIEKQLPVDRIESYRADFDKLYCFTEIVGAQVNTEVIHVWYFQESEMARITLPIRSADWRTYSSKRFLPQWAGRWRVEVLDGDGRKIATIPFQLE